MPQAVSEAWREVTRGGARELDGRMDLVVADIRARLEAEIAEMEAGAVAAQLPSPLPSPPASPQSGGEDEFGGAQPQPACKAQRLPERACGSSTHELSCTRCK